MAFNKDIHHRKSIRLRGYDYSQAGSYFITICTHQRQHLFGNIVDGMMTLNESGMIVKQLWHAIPDHFPWVRLDEFIVMPNHLHGILLVNDRRGTACRTPTKRPDIAESFGNPVSGSIPTIVRSFKSASTNAINSAANTFGSPLWQRNYHEHIIRNEHASSSIAEYIRTNPQKWQNDTYYTATAHGGTT